ncbi:glucosylglycerol 3-phosphatase [Salinicola aestuarinus]|uniref:glucosylglycerol 3-phosphatase n=1 Tax=Salinicola aestuarinus TaxID=1949082 RepID=UPI000DA1142D|nr:glucosylglycerol 3-phosphatase [Salinicola aestuarinus]
MTTSTACSQRKPRTPYSLDHAALLDALTDIDDLLIIQDLDGVCMGLVSDPLTRTLEPRYLEAAATLDGHFFVLTNGEHIGRRGVNGIVEATLAPTHAAGRYLPGLAAGGVQWQGRSGDVSHPGVTDRELAFLDDFVGQAERFLDARLSQMPDALPPDTRRKLIESAVLDNLASPTLNLNVFRRHWQDAPERYGALQRDVADFLQATLEAATETGLDGSFFVHYAPNAGRDDTGRERLVEGDGEQAGTTDFQLMLRGAVKEAGVLVILNRYYYRHTGHYPLGEGFNVREAPTDVEALVALARDHFDPSRMPTIVGVGDTVTSSMSGGAYRRGGSDRGFLTLVQRLGETFDVDNRVLYVDSSGGEVQRPGVDVARLRHSEPTRDIWPGLAGITDPDDALTFDVLFTQGHAEYVDFFCELARRRHARH